MENADRLLALAKQQEKELQFTQFTSETALEIGMLIVNRAKKENLAIAVDINRNGHQLFHFAAEGTSPDNDQWIIRKIRTVNRFGCSSLNISAGLELAGRTIEDKYHVSSMEYAAAGGSFPIIIKNVGIVGTITVSGLKQEEDHEVVVSAIRKYLGQ